MGQITSRVKLKQQGWSPAFFIPKTMAHVAAEVQTRGVVDVAFTFDPPHAVMRHEASWVLHPSQLEGENCVDFPAPSPVALRFRLVNGVPEETLRLRIFEMKKEETQ